MDYELDIAVETNKGCKHATTVSCAIADVQPQASGQSRTLLMVADGMGNDVASTLAVETVQTSLNWNVRQNGARDRLRQLSSGDNVLRLTCAFEKANHAIRQFAAANFNAAIELSATATALFIEGDEALTAKVGNCRAYLWRNEVLTQLTYDHALVTCSLGSRPDVLVDVCVTVLQPNDCLLLCTAGLWAALCDEEEFGRILKTSADARIAAQTLINHAKRRGGEDSMSVAVARLLH